MFNKILIANRGDASRRGAATKSNCLGTHRVRAISPLEMTHV